MVMMTNNTYVSNCKVLWFTFKKVHVAKENVSHIYTNSGGVLFIVLSTLGKYETIFKYFERETCGANEVRKVWFYF